jgi:hypothetical protein
MGEVLRVGDVSMEALQALLGRFRLTLELQGDDEVIRGSFWGESEAGLVATTVFVRSDTPIHSLLHETCHVICMTEERRAGLNRDTGGDDLEEAAVCYLQVLLADHIDGVGRERLMQDMDSWGYSFRLGSTRRWFEEDAGDARAWLVANAPLGQQDRVAFRLRS